jgi:DNA polymerase I-like protein with 3'-5' exonuclease and polymerase domains
VLTGYLVPYGRSTVNDAHLLLTSSSSQQRICASWNQCATGTGRLSCRNPNLQALPRTSTTKEDPTVEEEEEDDAEEGVEHGVALSTVESPVIGLTKQQEAKPINLPSDVNMRASIVPTPSTVVHDICRDREAIWDTSAQNVILPASETIDQLVAANEERCFLSADYSQMEVRLLAQLCQDEELLRVFQPAHQASDEAPAAASSSSSAAAPSSSSGGGDVYRRMASIMFQKSVSDVADAERTISKTIVLGVMYGMGADSLAGRLTKFSNRTVTSKDAQSYIQRLYEQFPKISKFMVQTKSDGAQNVSGSQRADRLKLSSSARALTRIVLALSLCSFIQGHVTTLVGRRRYLPDLQSSQNARKAYAERQAVNTVIQGSAADMTKMAMIGLRAHIRHDPELRASVWLSLQLHDEIILELPTRLIPRVSQLVRDVMEHVIPTASLPFTTNIKIGKGLGSMATMT